MQGLWNGGRVSPSNGCAAVGDITKSIIKVRTKEALTSTAAGVVRRVMVPPPLVTVSTPRLHQRLRKMTDREFATYITRGIAEGFHIGFDVRLAPTLLSAKSNMISMCEHPQVVTEYLKRRRAS